METPTFNLEITKAEWIWLSGSIPQDRGLELRAFLLSVALRGGMAQNVPEGDDWTVIWEGLTLEQLWIIDAFLYIANPWKHEKLSDGRELLDFAKKVWNILIDAKGPEQYREGGSDARISTRNNTDENRAPSPGSLSV
jgi:hypothetical protein